mmetsp:Transcript_34463/g.75350  ORF Transcript_34463/g.75350 Transcript_34463/m.75350 type:complete len:230 (-) Transcript_34463:220-909(-)|eukprot:CAMPEP_0118936274 /NCGR_PEP_ID=MMETSP1169-20130426/17781_1 /TAXON_ID=36882 /ORGANISM="Pyramimonas obovata, Strain CCMP722" /LENGTH=229 /DNA_ID=CAMNT_0006879459 /DNA_START=254 /DNA_END=943 /DNA_ORIENTATION=-
MAALRLQKEYKNILKDPVTGLVAHPSPSNVLDWHYVLQGAQGTDYEGGYYHGKIVFPEQYPFKPPAIMMITPSGRFYPNMRLCLSMSDFHPETWNPMWSVSTILTGLMSFMYDDVATTGSMHASSSERKRLAKESVNFNLKSPTFRKVFPDLVVELERIKQRALEEGVKHAKDGNRHGDTCSENQEGDQMGKLGHSAYGTQGNGASFGSVALIFVLLAVALIPVSQIWS